MIISDKIDFETKAIKRDTRHFIILKGKHPSKRCNPCKHVFTNIEAPKYIRKIEEDFKKDIDSNTLIVGSFNTPLSTMDRSSKQRINKDIVALNNTLDQMGLIDIYRTFYHKETKYNGDNCTCEQQLKN